MHRKWFYVSFFSVFGIVLITLLAAFIQQSSAKTVSSSRVTYTAPIIKEYKVYVDQLAEGWGDRSWNSAIDYASTAQVHAGTSAIAVTYQAQWASIFVATDAPISAEDYDLLRFWVHGGPSGGQSLKVVLSEAGVGFSEEAVIVPVVANQWNQIDISLADLGNVLNIEGVAWQENGQGAQPVMYLDDVSFVDLELPPTPTPVPVGGPTLNVNVDAERHLISEGIYGINFASEPLADLIDLPVHRWGGNATTRYNWKFDTANRASDWYFENYPSNHFDPSQLPEGSEVNQFVDQDRRTNTKTMLTMPLLGWTPKDRAIRCGFSVAKYGPQQDADPFNADCGNGKSPNGEEITNNDPTDTSMAIDETFVKEWMEYLIDKYGTAAQGGVAFYSLDNEPMLWNHTHRDVHPEPVSYDELRDLTYQYAPVIKATDPSAKLFGPALWGWTAYFYSAKDVASEGNWVQNPPDRNAHGGLPVVAWYLDQMRRYEEQTGIRILDYLDLHYYPAAAGVTLSGAGDADTQVLRLRTTRSLWDRSYVDESWINEPVYLIPRMREWVNQYYPGTKLALSEYNWGALDHINGALAQADVLGIFGREGLDFATLWAPPEPNDPGAFAFRIYRNYDGAGSRFGDIGVSAISSDQEKLSIYAAQRSSDGALTIMIINKAGESLTSTVAISGAFEGAANAQVYTYGAGTLRRIEQQPDVAVTGGGVSGIFHANSITLIVIPAATGGPVATPLPTPIPTAPPTPVVKEQVRLPIVIR